MSNIENALSSRDTRLVGYESYSGWHLELLETLPPNDASGSRAEFRVTAGMVGSLLLAVFFAS